jgi:hypothetical protein
MKRAAAANESGLCCWNHQTPHRIIVEGLCSLVKTKNVRASRLPLTAPPRASDVGLEA